MAIDHIIEIIKEHIHLRNSISSSDQYNFPLEQSKKELEAEIIKLIDSRIKAYLSREKRRSSTAQMPAPSVFSDRETRMLDALNSAPIPFSINSNNTSEWMDNYRLWYEKRSKALK